MVFRNKLLTVALDRFYFPGGDFRAAKLTGMTIKRGKIKTHKSPNETHKNPWTKIKPKRVTCQKTELFSDFRCPMSSDETSDIKLQTSETGHQITDNAPMSDVQCPMSDVWCPMSDIWCLISHVWCPISDIWGPMSDICCLMPNI